MYIYYNIDLSLMAGCKYIYCPAQCKVLLILVAQLFYYIYSSDALIKNITTHKKDTLAAEMSYD